MQQLIALFVLMLSSPFLVVMYFVFRLNSNRPFIFKQLRAGKDKKPFTIYKIRTMVEGAEEKKQQLLPFNERTGPVFKIRNDPRFTKIGKFLSHTGLDELPQLINIIKGDMAFVGPRPLPVDEAQNVPQKYLKRFSILPGITSPWAIKGPHQLTFNEWMELDLSYVSSKSQYYDILICFKTMSMILRSIISTIFSNHSRHS